ncbi:MAG: Cys-tRNA(Pro) deacylase [Rhodobiaceae bacterium]|nr:Cys-tRNA(Pro) deacylase [Rhodobiaceae bacterium]
MTKGETAAERYVRLNNITAKFHIFNVPKDTKTSARDMAVAGNISPARLFKTLVVQTDNGTLVCTIVPADKELDRKKLARHLNSKRVDLAPKDIAIKASGYQMGACSPLGQCKKLPTIIDSSATQFETVFVSGGALGLQMEIAPDVLISATDAETLTLA